MQNSVRVSAKNDVSLVQNDVITFNSAEFGNVRTVVIDGQPWFVGKDVATSLGYGKGKSLNNAVADHVDEEDKGVTKMETPGGKQNVIIINESGLYSLILGSKLESAKKFKRWVTSEVLPTIRKTDSYQVIPPKVDERVIALEEDKQKVAKANIFLVLSEKYRDNKDYSQILDAYATKAVEGTFVLPLPERGEADYSATEAGKELGISSKTVGKIANKLEIKVDGENGKWYLDKSPYSNKEVQTFRYSRKGIEKIKEFLEAEKKA